MTLSDKTISGTFGDMTFTDGVAEFTLRDGQTVSAEGLPAGVTYKVEEEKTKGFTTTYSGETGTISTEKSTAEVTNSTTQMTVEKVWNDNDDRDGLRPDWVMMQLYRAVSGGEQEMVDIQSLPGPDGSLTYTWTGLETADGNGNPYVYSVREAGENSGKIADRTGEMTYLVTYDTSGEGKTVVTNSHVNEPEKSVFSDPGCTTRIDGQLVEEGQTLVYRITYANQTGQTAGKVTITDRIPAPTTYTEGTARSTVNGASGPAGVLSGDTLTWTFTDVPSGAKIEAVFEVTVNEGKSSEIRNKGTVDDGTNRFDTNEVVNSKPVKDVFDPADPKVSIDGKTVLPGQELVYSITYRNDTGEPVSLEITDRIPANTSYVEGSASDEGTYENRTVTWAFDAVDAGETVAVTFRVRVDEAPGDSVSIANTATVREGENERSTNETVNGTPVRHDPPVLKKITGGKPEKDETFRFRLTAVRTDADAAMPMPEGASGKTLDVETKAGAEKEFGDIVFTEPGSYWYTIEEIDTGIDGYKYDKSVYQLHYTVERQEDGRLTMTLETTKNGAKVSEAVYTFTNEYVPEDTPPDTGDTNMLPVWIALMAVTGTVSALLWIRRRREDR